ncbi:hypothetical protein GGR50DRAFT_673501 [Xylaria sp. CBS 124048]|nr:hypothetical protein GGR50DRAFT_673501 [Xylaria sp. CBS 124048]
MVRKRVLSFMSHFSRSQTVDGELQPNHDDASSSPGPSTSRSSWIPTSLGDRQSSYYGKNPRASVSDFFHLRGHSRAASSFTPASPSWGVNHESSPVADSPPVAVAVRNRSRSRSSSRPLSMVSAYHPPHMDINQDTIPELQPIFGFLNSHVNKLYQEGYFLKLDDQNSQGRPNGDRTWTECFAQLVGTVLSLWDAAELDAAGENGEVLPKFINLTDASIKMIDSLPTSASDGQPLHNILSISTAGRNRYLLHFNSKSSLIQWTSGIRLAMFEHATLQEAYTGALIAGKGKSLNNIGLIMERSRVQMEQWVRVRFGAGVPWRRCWCVISPPDEKEYQKLLKEHKKKNPYDRSHPPILKGDIKFYDQKKEGKKQKKMQPIATINDAYSAYALYPQAKALIEASTLIKIEGDLTIHADPPSLTEGFVFIMPEVSPAISGFEMMLRFLFPTWDTFGLYGRPGRLVASVLDARSLMFAMPKHRRYGYLELLDVSGLISTDGSAGWNERTWRQKLKELTGTRMNTTADESESGTTSRTNSSRKRLSSGLSAGGIAKPRVGFADEGPQTAGTPRSVSANSSSEGRNGSGFMNRDGMSSATNGMQAGHFPGQFTHSGNATPGFDPTPTRNFTNDSVANTDTTSPDEALPFRDFEGMRRMQTPEPVSRPPMFSHAPGDKPNYQPYHSPELRRATSRLSLDTLDYLGKALGTPASRDGSGPGKENGNDRQEETNRGFPASRGSPSYGIESAPQRTGSPFNPTMGAQPSPRGLPSHVTEPVPQRTGSPLNPAMAAQPNSRGPTPSPRPKTPTSRSNTGPGNRTPGPPNQGGPPGNYPTYRGPPPTGPLPGPPGTPESGRGRGRPLPNAPSGRGYSGNAPPGMQNSYQPGPNGPDRRDQMRSPPPNAPKQLPLLNTSPIHRKPLPARTDSLSRQHTLENITPASESSNSGSATGNRIDLGGFGQVRAQNLGSSTPQPSNRRHDAYTLHSEASSLYGDIISTSSPDYASSRPSTGTSSLAERPRAGVLRTVGTTGDSPQSINTGFDIPGIDFGPTLNYAAAPRSLASPGGIAASETSNTSTRRGQSPSAAPPRQPPSEVDENKRRSVIWQPAATIAGSSVSSGPGLSAEEFVQQKLTAAAAAPLYAHQRHSSGITLSGYRAGTPTPPLGRGQDSDQGGSSHSRNTSQDLLQRRNSQASSELLTRPKSGDMLQRPGSRGAGAILGGQQSQGSSYLSAREQEHVARVTGSPLINMAGNKNGSPASEGLVAAIEVRERGREQMKQGWASPAVQSAIQRQQQTYQGLPSPPPAGMYSNMHQTMASSPRQQGAGMPRRYGSPGPGQGLDQGNWMPSSGGFRSPPPGNMDPRFMPPQGQFPSSPSFSIGPQGGAGAGYSYQGHAF